MGVFHKLSDPIIFFSQCRGTPIYNENGKRLGKLQDFFIDFEEAYPTVIAIQFKSRNEIYFSNWISVREFNYERITLSNNARIRRGKTFPKIPKQKSVKSLLKVNNEAEIIDYPPLGSIVLNKQVVDTHGKKAVRVFDIHFIKIGRLLRVTHADTNKSKAHGLTKVIVFFESLFTKKLKNEDKIPWKYVHTLGTEKTGEDIQLNVSNEELESMHPADLADIIEDLDDFGRKAVFKNLDPEMAAETLVEIEDNLRSELIRGRSNEEVAEIIDELESDEAVDLISELDPSKTEDILSQVKDKKAAEEIQDLLKFPPNSAGGIMSTETFTTQIGNSRKTILQHLQMHYDDYENIYDIFILDDQNKLIGVCPLKLLVTSLEDLNIEDIMQTEDLQSIQPYESWLSVSQIMSKYNLINLPVCDQENKLLGHISVDDILPWLLKEKE